MQELKQLVTSTSSRGKVEKDCMQPSLNDCTAVVKSLEIDMIHESASSTTFTCSHSAVGVKLVRNLMQAVLHCIVIRQK